MDTPAVGNVRDDQGVSDHSEVSLGKSKKVMFADESKQGLSLESVIFFEPYNHQEIDIESEKLGLPRSITLRSLATLPESVQAQDLLESAQRGKVPGSFPRPKRAHQEMQRHTKSGLRSYRDDLLRPIARRLATQSIDFGPFSAEPVHDVNETDTRTGIVAKPSTGVMGSVSMWYREQEETFFPPGLSNSSTSAEDRARKKG